jgi:diamine N-acetyltransferase
MNAGAGATGPFLYAIGGRNMPLSLRPARPGEARLVLGFIRELAVYERLAHEVEATEADIEAALFGANPNTFCDIAEWDNEPVGYALWFLNFSTFRGRNGLYLEDLFVRPSHRGRGIGRALLTRLAQKCVENRWAQLEWAVLDWNAPAIRFYESCGAKMMSDWRLCHVSGEALQRLASG